jgi:integrase/recombinase XerD
MRATRPLGRKAAVLYRNGAIVMGAALQPLRRHNWGGIRLNRHLRVAGERAWLTVEPDELKSSRTPIEIELPAEYVLRLKRYIAVYRPVLRGETAADSHALWLTMTGVPLSERALSAAVSSTLLARSGRRFSFHMFRHAAATFIEEVAPDQVQLAAGLLHHADLRMTRKHYIRGQRTAAAKKYHTLVRDIARQGRGAHGRAKRKGTAR